ncbi:hypothetical protein VTN96DRAFT_9367 [Rasamsonia emersonii]
MMNRHDRLFQSQQLSWESILQWTSMETFLPAKPLPVDWNQFGLILSHKPKGNPDDAYLSHEHVVWGDETGVQGRFRNNAGQVYRQFSEQLDNRLALGLDQTVPDVVCFTTGHSSLPVVGELKTLWVQDHKFNLTSAARERKLGQSQEEGSTGHSEIRHVHRHRLELFYYRSHG